MKYSRWGRRNPSTESLIPPVLPQDSPGGKGVTRHQSAEQKDWLTGLCLPLSSCRDLQMHTQSLYVHTPPNQIKHLSVWAEHSHLVEFGHPQLHLGTPGL